MGGSPSVSSGRIAAVLVTLLVVLATAPGLAAAEPRSGGTVVVAEDETVGDLEAFGGTVIVRGTVDGDLQAFGGDVRIEGEVTGNVEASAGTVRISGTVGGDVEAAAGTVYVEPTAEIGGSLSAAAGNVVLAGTVGGNADLAGGSVTLAETATVDGDVRYGVGEDGTFVDEGATVGGTITRTEGLQAGPWQGPQVPDWVFGVYGFLVNLVLGAVLLLLFPRFSAGVAERVGTQPLRSGAYGLLALVGIPIALVAVAITIVGIPLAIVGAALFGLLVWVALVYGRFAVGAWLLSLLDYEHRWVALVGGLVLFGLLARLPWVGGLIDLVVVLLGLGAVVGLAYAGYRDRGEADASE